jgi:hypothetical protein
MIGAENVARAAPDGYTILANASLHVINPSIQPKMRFDAFKGLQAAVRRTCAGTRQLIHICPRRGTTSGLPHASCNGSLERPQTIDYG